MLRMAVGKIETRRARTAIATVPITFWRTTRKSGAIRIAQGSSKGRLLAFAPVKSAADNAESQTSKTCRFFQARKAKPIAAKPYTVGKVSLPALPACKRKAYPAGKTHIHCQATRPQVPRDRPEEN